MIREHFFNVLHLKETKYSIFKNLKFNVNFQLVSEEFSERLFVFGEIKFDENLSNSFVRVFPLFFGTACTRRKKLFSKNFAQWK